ncbi:LOW QUALITY PROTEIN: carcinoembryonic antigen-related cell adhesion molecule 19 [Peromyscus californicus insignis]|uniref:LOW QUALITY PROTEIN: carcinoembryonic antigen-related cell adhesion molecule 19 n=1 Tax=Peromyscus californicus insignis TaxID=564181 RepID=UPI0022A6794D|nr:LOW QUALITY PROTEIN: carcinoembryonic antigen-related cell adhesion molecule 19 [Peromyscus californicus insignis]
MEIPTQTQGCFSKGLLFSALILALWLPQGSQAALHIQKIPEQPQKSQDLLLSLHGVPSTVQDFIWYLGEETNGGTRLFSYIPGLPRPQRDGSAMGHRDIVGFPNGSMLLRGAQPSDSGTYQVAVTINPAWTMKAKTEVQVAGMREYSVGAPLPVNAGIMAAVITGSLAVGSLLVGGIAYLLVTRRRKGRSPRVPAPNRLGSLSRLLQASLRPLCSRTGRQEPSVTEVPTSSPSGDSNIYEVMPSPVFLVSPISDTEPVTTATSRPPLPSQQAQPENQHYQDLLNPDPAPYCQLVPTS